MTHVNQNEENISIINLVRKTSPKDHLCIIDQNNNTEHNHNISFMTQRW